MSSEMISNLRIEPIEDRKTRGPTHWLKCECDGRRYRVAFGRRPPGLAGPLSVTRFFFQLSRAVTCMAEMVEMEAGVDHPQTGSPPSS